MLDELKSLLLNIDFLQAKLEQTNSNALIDDCDTFKDENGSFTDDSMRLMQSAIGVSSHVITENSEQLLNHLYARLMSHDTPDIRILLDNIRQQEEASLLPLHQTMQAGGGSLIRSLQGHSFFVRSRGDTGRGRHLRFMGRHSHRLELAHRAATSYPTRAFRPCQ